MSSNEDPSAPVSRSRRASITTQTLSGIFGRPNAPTSGTPAIPQPISTAAAQEHGRRRLSVTGVGLTSTSPTAAFASFNRRSSVSTAGSESIDESAIEDGDGPATNPQTPFRRRLSYGAQALRTVRTGSSPGNDEGFNWSEQFRSRAESTVSGMAARPPRVAAPPQPAQSHTRAVSVGELQGPPSTLPKATAAAALPSKKPERPKPDAIGERILRGQFMMD